LVLGAIAGTVVNFYHAEWASYFQPFSQLFLRLIKMIIAPLIFATLVAGIVGAGHLRQVGRIGVVRLSTSKRHYHRSDHRFGRRQRHASRRRHHTSARWWGDNGDAKKLGRNPAPHRARVGDKGHGRRRSAADSHLREPAVIAFSTTSSEAALPRAMEVLERLGVPRRIVAFALPLGYSFNLDGSTLYLSLAAVFVAQAAGVELTVGQQITMLLTLMLTSKGVAGVPRASLVILAGTLASYNLPLAGITLILGVDELMDMARTMTNVIGNCLATVIVAKWEGEFREASDDDLAAAASRGEF
jgi:Na+/H+-dicarboxylate symporter